MKKRKAEEMSPVSSYQQNYTDTGTTPKAEQSSKQQKEQQRNQPQHVKEDTHRQEKEESSGSSISSSSATKQDTQIKNDEFVSKLKQALYILGPTSGMLPLSS